MKFPFRALLIGSIYAAIFAYVAVVACNRQGILVPSTQISSIAILFCLFLVLLLNPLLRLIKAKPFDRREVFLVFIMAVVPASIPVYGLVCQTIPLMGGLHNPEWNTAQSEWDSKLSPNLDPDFFIGSPIFTVREVKEWGKFSAAITAGKEPSAASAKSKIWKSLTTETQKKLEFAAGGGSLSAGDKQDIAENLRTILANEGLFSDADLPQDQAHAIIDGMELLSKRDKAMRLNRLMFESAFPGLSSGNKFLQDQTACIDYVYGLSRYGKEAWPAFVKKDNESWREFSRRVAAVTSGDAGSFIGNVPWKSWGVPLFKLLLPVLCIYALFYSLNELVFKQWYEREKLIFPIAEFSSSLLTNDSEAGGNSIPDIYRKPAFWLGFGISFSVLLYNGLVDAHLLEGLKQIDLSCRINRELANTALGGLNPHFRTEIFFTCIGLAFLLPLEISFSIWFFYIVMMMQQLAAVWMGYGIDAQSFPQDWLENASFMTAQGGGAIEVFGVFCLWKVRHHFLAFIYRFSRRKQSGHITADEVKTYTFPSLLFFISSVGVFWLLRMGNVSWGMCFLTYFAWLMITISMVRLVAECGLVAFHAWFGPIHIAKIFGLMKFAMLFAAGGVSTVILLTAGFFIDLKTFIAPTLMNAKYLSVKHKVPNRIFLLGISAGILITLVVSVAVTLMLVYDQGLNSMEGWFFSANPHNSTFKIMKNLSENIGSAQQVDPATAPWVGVGATICALLLYGRQFLCWLPHPIGYLMFANPLMAAHWFSFFVAWVCKRYAIKYCSAHTYKSVRSGFVGLVLGEITAIGISLLLALGGYVNMGLSLDR